MQPLHSKRAHKKMSGKKHLLYPHYELSETGVTKDEE